MKGAVQIAKFFGIPVQIHWTFGLILIYIGYIVQSSGLSWEGTVWVALFFLALFTCVVLHEFGHALSARHYGVKTHDIILSPIGGIARLDNLPEKPFQEFVIAIAGPLVNIGIALALLPYLYYFTDFFSNLLGNNQVLEGNSDAVFSKPVNFLPALFILNIGLAVFNLLPAFPMDGGRVLRALLSIRFSRVKATGIAAFFGQAIAVVFFLFGVVNSDYIIAFIGLFVFFTATNEYRMVKLDERLTNNKVGEIMRTRFTTFQPGYGIPVVANELRQGLEKSFLIVDERGQVIGITYDSLIRKAQKDGDVNTSIGEFMRKDWVPLNTADTLKYALQLMQQKAYPILPVFENGQLVGVIDVRIINDVLSN